MTTVLRILPMGDQGVLVEHPDPLALYRAAQAALDAGAAPSVVAELVPAERTLLVRFAAPTRVDTVADRIAAWLTGLRPVPVATAAARGVTIEVRYDGVDLAETAALVGLSPAALIDWHTSVVWTCAFVGFAPGFGYLTPADGPGGRPLDVPRLDAPRPVVPAGAVALAGGYGGVYPRSSPGGWRLIGRTDAAMWDLARPAPALLSPGVRVVFREPA